MPDSSYRFSCLLPLSAYFAFTTRQASREGIRQVSQAKRQQVNGGAGRQMNKKIGGWFGGWMRGLMNGGSNFTIIILTVYLNENEIIRESFLSV
jgi:hypothetical protein